MADDGKIIFKPEFDLSGLETGAEAARQRIFLLYQEVEQLGKAEKQRFVSQLGLIEQLQLREQRLQALRSKAPYEREINKLNAALQQTQSEMQKLEGATGKTQTKFTSFTGQVGNELRSLAATFGVVFSIVQLKDFFETGIKLAAEETRTFSQLAYQLQSIDGYTKQITESFKQQAKQSGDGLFSSGDIAKAQLMLEQFGLIPEQIQKAIPIIRDFAIGTNKSFSEASQVFVDGLKGRSLELRNYRVFVDASGSATENFDRLTTQLGQKFAGAAAGLDAYSLDVQKVGVSYQNFLQGVGNYATPGIQSILSGLNKLFGLTSEGAPAGNEPSRAQITVETLKKELVDAGAEMNKVTAEVERLANFTVFEKGVGGLDAYNQRFHEAVQAQSEAIDRVNDLQTQLAQLVKLNERPKPLKTPGDIKVKVKIETELEPLSEKYWETYQEQLLARSKKFFEKLKALAESELEDSGLPAPTERAVTPTVLAIPDPGFVTRLDAFLEKYNETYGQIVDIALNAFDTILQGEISLNEAQIRIQTTRVDQALKVAERGNAEYLQKEQERLDTLERKQEAFARQQAFIAEITAVANVVAAVASAAAQSGILSPIAIAEVIAAIATGIGAGITLVKAQQTGFRKGGHTGDGRPDDVAGVVHKREFVFDEETTEKNRPEFEEIHTRKLNLRSVMDKARSYDSIQAKINTSRLSEMVVVHNKNEIDLSKLRGDLHEIVQAIRGKKETSVNITKDGIGIVASEYISDSKKLSKLAS